MSKQISMNTLSNDGTQGDAWWEDDDAIDQAINNFKKSFQQKNDPIQKIIQENEDEWWKNDENIDNLLKNFHQEMNSPNPNPNPETMHQLMTDSMIQNQSWVIIICLVNHKIVKVQFHFD